MRHGGKEMQVSMRRCKPHSLPVGRILKVLTLHREDAGAQPGELPSLKTLLCSMWCSEGTMLFSAGRVEPEFKMRVWLWWPATGTLVLLHLHNICLPENPPFLYT